MRVICPFSTTRLTAASWPSTSIRPAGAPLSHMVVVSIVATTQSAREQLRHWFGPVDQSGSGGYEPATIGDQDHVRCHDLHQLL